MSSDPRTKLGTRLAHPLWLSVAFVIATVAIIPAFVFAVTSADAAESRSQALITITATNYRVTGNERVVGHATFYTSLLYNRRVSFNAIGHATLVCTFIGRGGPLGSGTSECYGTFVLPRGKITVHGSRKNLSYYVLAVTGGTGLYSNADGQLIVSARGAPEGTQRLVFSLE